MGEIAQGREDLKIHPIIYKEEMRLHLDYRTLSAVVSSFLSWKVLYFHDVNSVKSVK